MSDEPEIKKYIHPAVIDELTEQLSKEMKAGVEKQGLEKIDPAALSAFAKAAEAADEAEGDRLTLQALLSVQRARTPEQLLERITERAGADPYGFEREVYASYLTEENSLKANAPTKGYPRRVYEWPAMLQEMRDFLVTARAQSSQFQTFLLRAVHRYLAWSWLAGDELFAANLADQLAAGLPEGSPILDEIDTHFGLTPKA